MTDFPSPKAPEIVAREWWLDIATPYGDPCDFIDTKPHEHPSATNIHVIEYSAFAESIVNGNILADAYEKLRADLTLAVEALEYSIGAINAIQCCCIEIDGHREACLRCQAESTMAETLDKLRGRE